MVGAAPVCPPERPRSGVSIRKRHVPIHKSSISIRKGHILPAKEAFPSAKGTSPPAKEPFPFINDACSHQNTFVHCADGCALAGRRGRAHRHRPYQLPSNPSATQPSSFLSVGEPLPATFSRFNPSSSTSPARLCNFNCVIL